MSLIKKQYCPQCGSDNVVLAEPSSGQMMCKECFYCGNDFPEEDVIAGSGANRVEEIPITKASMVKSSKKTTKKPVKKTKGKKR